MPSDEMKQWQKAMKRELNSLEENKTWRLVDKPDKEMLDVKWVKRNQTRLLPFKAKLVVINRVVHCKRRIQCLKYKH